MSKCPNQFPAVEPSGSARIAIVGEAPGEQEVHFAQPFVGPSGLLLNDNLGLCGIPRNQCFVGNVAQVQPAGNDFGRFDWNGTEVQEGVAQLKADLERFRPTIVLCLGNAALHLFKNGNVAPPRKGKEIDWPDKVGSWRGSLFESVFTLGFKCSECLQGYILNMGEPWKCYDCDDGVIQRPIKCLVAFHPAAVLREYALQGYYRTGLPGVGDFERLRLESGSAELELPRRGQVIFAPDKGELYDAARAWKLLCGLCQSSKHTAIDIEGYPGNITCIAFAQVHDFAYVIPFAHVDGTSVWSEEDEVVLWHGIKAVLEDPAVPKIFQHGQYDLFALAWTYGIAIRNWSDDTEEGGWELCAELRKGLATQASLYTKQQFYKPDKEDGEMVFESDEQFWTYNGTDAAVTFEVWQRQQALMLEPQRCHYKFNMSLKPVILYMSLKGMKVDRERVEEESGKAMRGAMELQAQIDEEAARIQLEQDGTDSDLRLLKQLMDAPHERLFAVLALRCLGGKNPRVRAEEVEERWQPMRWQQKLKGKEPEHGKWVKNGRLTKGPVPMDAYCGENPPESAVWPWWKPKHRTVSCLRPFTPATPVDCEPFILGKDGDSDDAKEKQRAWRRVKAIWKELHEKTQNPATDTETEKRSKMVGDSARPFPSKGGNQELLGNLRNRAGGALLGELSTLLGLAVNASSTSEGGDAQWFLFELCGLPRVWKDERTGRYGSESEAEWRRRTKGEGLSNDDASRQTTNEANFDTHERKPTFKPPGKKLSTDQNALDLLYAKTQDVRVLWVLQQRRLKKVVTDLAKEIDDDGRIRCSFSLVKETGRMAASESPTGTGTNLQAWNKDLRRVVVADEGCLMGQYDLEGADSWTVAAECAALGDVTMLEDLKAGLKPAKVLCLLYLFGDQVNGWDRAKIKAKLKEIEMPEWLYPGAKSCLHGSSYGMGLPTMIQTVLKYSMADLPLELGDTKPIVMETAQARKLQEAFFSRYPGVKRWHEAEKRNLLNKGFIVTSCGHLRRFYGRKAEWKKGQKVANHETLKEALASKPQFYTTWANKMAVWRMWNAPENRTEARDLKVEPLTVVHDSILFAFGKEERAGVGDRVRQWFNNEVEIAGVKVTIPADGTVGLDWSMKGATEKL